MMTHSKDIQMEAASYMKAGRFPEAIPLLEQCVAIDPMDLKSLLHLGICHLLNRSEKVFLSIFEEATQLKSRLKEIPPDVLRVFTQYESLVKKVTATALVLGTVTAAASGCGLSAHKYSGGVYVPPDTAKIQSPEMNAPNPDTATDGNDAGSEISDTERASADTGSDSEIVAGTESDAGEALKMHVGGHEIKPDKVISAHRYSGGVLLRSTEKQ